MKEILQQSRQGRCGAVDVASEGSPPEDAADREVPDFDSRNSVASVSMPLPSIPEERSTDIVVPRTPAPTTPAPQTPGVGQGHLLRNVGQGAITTEPALPAEAPSTPMTRTRASTREEPLAEPAPPDKKPRVSEVSVTGSEPSSTPRSDQSRVKRQVSEIELSIEEQESKRLEKKP